MKYFVISLFLISFVGFIIPQAFSAGENFFYGTTTFERLPTGIVPNNPTKFEIKFHYTAGSYALENLTPVIEVSPEGAKSKVHFDVKPVSAYQNDIVRIPVTITVDPDIEYEKIFLSISYAGIGLHNVPFKSSWADSIIFDIASDVDSQTIPCYDAKEIPYPCNPEESKEFYTYKGKEWMEQKKLEMISFLNTGNPNDFHAWIDQAKDHSNWNVYQYYSITEDMTKYVVPESPHEQLDRGTAPQNIRCVENLVLILKHDGMPACVQEETKVKLIGRGWMKTQVNVFNEFSFIESTKHLDEVKLFLSLHPDAKVSVNPDWFTVEYEKSGLKKHTSSSIIQHTKRLIVNLDHAGKPTAYSVVCGGPISLEVHDFKVLTNMDWCFPLDQTPFDSSSKTQREN